MRCFFVEQRICKSVDRRVLFCISDAGHCVGEEGARTEEGQQRLGGMAQGERDSGKMFKSYRQVVCCRLFVLHPLFLSHRMSSVN